MKYDPNFKQVSINSFPNITQPRISKIIKIFHLSIIDTSLRGKSKLSQNSIYSSNLVLTRTTRTVENTLFSTEPLHGLEQAR